jgi:hypothetical protein
MNENAKDRTEAKPPAGQTARTFQPSPVQATRTREQGNGVGQKELNQQRDPTRADNARP